MPELKITDKNWGYSVISDKISMMIKDIDFMLEEKDISKLAASHLLKHFEYIAQICNEFKDKDELSEKIDDVTHKGPSF